MSICKHTGARLLLLSIMLMLSQSVFALGLGNATVESYLNQALNARVEILTREGEDLSTVTAKLASAEDYALIGASRDAVSVPLRFTIETQSGQPAVRVTSNLPVNQPVIRLILELNWASGRLLREYTLFLDPPSVPAVAPPPVIDERRNPAPAVIAPAAVEDTQPAEQYEEIESAEAGQEAGSSSSGTFTGDDEYGPVQSGDTLWTIASNWSDGSSASVNQVMLAIQRNNPQAFINNNINLLKRGAILRMPSAADIDAISAAEARNEVLAQSRALSGGADSDTDRDTVPTAPAALAPAVETPLVDVASDLSSESSDEPVADTSGQLEIVPPSEESFADSAYGDEDSSESATASTSVVALQEELARKEEALITEQQTNEYLQERITELESRLVSEDSDPLTVADEELAGMESRLKDSREAAEEEAAPATDDIPKVQTSNDDSEAAWYSSWILWAIALLIALAAGFGFYRSRQADGGLAVAVSAADEGTVRGIKDEAEEILKVLEPVEEDADEDNEPNEGETAQKGVPVSATDGKSSKFGKARHDDSEEASLLDEDSADPEVRLDLARAYISMGDREAARAILGEVVEHGDEQQVAEAQAMLDQL